MVFGGNECGARSKPNVGKNFLFSGKIECKKGFRSACGTQNAHYVKRKSLPIDPSNWIRSTRTKPATFYRIAPHVSFINANRFGYHDKAIVYKLRPSLCFSCSGMEMFRSEAEATASLLHAKEKPLFHTSRRHCRSLSWSLSKRQWCGDAHRILFMSNCSSFGDFVRFGRHETTYHAYWCQWRWWCTESTFFASFWSRTKLCDLYEKCTLMLDSSVILYSQNDYLE